MSEQSTATITNTVFGELLSARFLQQEETNVPVPQTDPLANTLLQSGTALLERQYRAGYWRFDLEADTTIPSEYILLQHLLGTVDTAREQRLADYIISRQLPDGSWPLYEGGSGNISATVKAYFALKTVGHDPAAEAMQRACAWVRNNGGAERVNIFTRILLASFGQVLWRTVPAMPAEIIWLPRWWFFSLDKVSYWSRCVTIPLLLIFSHRPVQRGTDIKELFKDDPESLKHIDKFIPGKHVKNCFILLERLLKLLEALVPGFIRQVSVRKLETWMREHMRGEGGIGAIFPAMANAVYALKLLGCDATDPDLKRGIQAIEDLVIEEESQTYVQPCVSPVWDTCLSLSALSEAGLRPDNEAIKSATDWLFDKQVFIRGTGSEKRRIWKAAVGRSSLKMTFILTSMIPAWWSWPCCAPAPIIIRTRKSVLPKPLTGLSACRIPTAAGALSISTTITNFSTRYLSPTMEPWSTRVLPT